MNWIRLFTFPQTWAYITGKGLIDPIYWFFLFWLPSYFSSIFNLNLKKPSLELMLIYTATTVGRISGGWFSSRLIKRGRPVIKARKTVMLVIAFFELSVILIQFVTNVWVAVGLISFAVAIHQAWATNVFTLPSDMFPKQVVTSIGGMAGALGGIFFPMLIGTALDTYKATGNLAGDYNIIFTTCGCTYLVAWLIIHLLSRKSKMLKLEEL